MTIAEPKTSEWIEKVRSLQGVIAEHRDESEQMRHLATPVYEAMRQIGLFKLWLPKALGGDEADIHTALEIIEQLASYDGSTAWNFAIGLQGGALLGFMPEERARVMMQDNPDATAGGSGQPGGVAVPVEGGYRISGRWPFASGCNHTRWLGGNCTIQDQGVTRLDADGNPELHMFFFSSDEYEIIDTWHTTGLRASGSHDIKVEDVFVPEDRKVKGALTKSPYQAGTIFQTRVALLLGPPLAAVGIGIASEAIDAFAELALSKTPSRSSRTLAENDHIVMTLGRAEAKVRAARSYLHSSMCDRLWPEMVAGNGDSEAAAVDVFYASAFAAQNAAEAVDMLQQAAGTSGIYEGNVIERCFRDVHMVTQHAGAAPANYSRGGRYRLGFGFSMRR